MAAQANNSSLFDEAYIKSFLMEILDIVSTLVSRSLVAQGMTLV